MKTIEEVLNSHRGTTAEQWRKHANGGGWVQITATVEDGVWIYDDAQISGRAQISGNAQISGDAQISDHAQISGNAWIYGNAHILGRAQISGNAWISGDVRISGNAQISGRAQIFGRAQISGDAWISGNAHILGDAWGASPLYMQGTKFSLTNSAHGYIKIGCRHETFNWWLANGRELGVSEGWTEAQIDEYERHVHYMIANGVPAAVPAKEGE